MIDRSKTRDTPKMPVAGQGRRFVWELELRKPSWLAFMCERNKKPDI